MKPHPIYSNYLIYEDGKVFSVKSNKYLKPYKSPYGYFVLKLPDKLGKLRHVLIHRLVCEVYLANPENKKEVNHINGIKTDNRLSNLEWNTRSENMTHAKKNGLFKNKKAIIKYDLNGVFIKEYDSILLASIDNKVLMSNIVHCCKGKIKTSGGFIWKYK